MRNARTMGVLLYIIIAIQILLIPGEINLRSKALKFLDGDLSFASFEDAVNRQQSFMAIQSAVTLAVAILTMVWMRKMMRNHRRLGRPGSKWRPGWGIGGWFVPPGAIYAVPWLIFKELWRGSDPANTPGDPNWTQRPVSPLVHVWWVLYGFVPLVGLVLTSVVLSPRLNMSFGAEVDARDAADFYTDLFWVQMLMAIASIASAVVYSILVRRLSERQSALWGGH